MNNIRKIFTTLSLSMTLTVAACSACATEWRFAIEEISGSIMDNYAQEFKRVIELKSNGDVTVIIYPMGSLGTPTELVEQVSDGIIQFANISVGNLGTIVPESQVFLLPYTMPSDSKELANLLGSSKVIYNNLNRDFESRGLQLHTMYSEGEQVWTTNREIRSPQDFKNFKMRVMVSPLLLQAYQDLGASPTPVPFGEIYGALQLRQVDGQINPAATIEEMKFYEVSDYLIWAGEQQLVTTLLSGTDWYQTLKPEHKKLISDTTKELQPFIYELVQHFNQQKLALIKAAKPGIKLLRLTEQEQLVFRERSKATHNTYIDIVGKRGKDLLDAFAQENQ